MNSGKLNKYIPYKLIIKLWHHLSRRRKRQFFALFLLMLTASMLEIISVGTILPFLGVLIAPEAIYNNVMMQPVIRFLDLTEPNQLLLPVTSFFIIAALISGVVRLTLLQLSTRLSFVVGNDLSVKIYRRTLYESYSDHISQNSSEIINSIINKSSAVTFNVLIPLMLLLSSTLSVIAISSFLLFVDKVITAILFFTLGAIYIVIIRFTHNILGRNSQIITGQTTKALQALQEGLGNIRDVLIDGNQKYYVRIYKNADLSARIAHGDNQFISSSPRYAMESIGMIIIAGLAYIMSQQTESLVTAIPVLGTLALGLQRLLPAGQQIYYSLSMMQGANKSLIDIVDLLNRPPTDAMSKPFPEPIPFEKEISLNNLSFRFNPSSPWILENINLKLKKGSRIGFIGDTGSGKSTFLDIIMGLLEPTEGNLSVDGQPITEENHPAWFAHIAHVPQDIYLSDSAIEENIAFGKLKEEINNDRVRQTARQAHISDMIERLPEQYRTFVGERGVRLSGGQRQRIGLARALYKNADIIVLDEATSALDNNTELAIMEAIDKFDKDLTVFIVAHRLTTLRNCDQIFEIGNDGVLRARRYDKL